MKKIRIAVTALTGRVIAGTQNSKGNAITEGSHQDVTSDFMKAVIDKAEHHGGSFVIEGGDQKWEVVVKESRAEPSAPVERDERSPKDYAIEHAEYMAKSADDVVAKYQAYSLALLAVDEGGDDGEGELFEAIDSARGDLQESLANLRSMVYEFRKRSAKTRQEYICTPPRCNPSTPPFQPQQRQGHLMPEETLIGPVDVVRDESGYWYHPGIPDFDEDHVAWKAWLDDQGLKVVGWHMDSDLEAHPYWEEDEAHCLGWEPEVPPGDGWFLLGIFDTDDRGSHHYRPRETLTHPLQPARRHQAGHHHSQLEVSWHTAGQGVHMKSKRQATQPRRELVKISEFQRRVWGENGTPLCSQAIRNQIRNDQLPGERVGKLWFVDWTSYQNTTGNDLVDSVLRGAA